MLPDAGYAGTDLTIAVVADVDTVSPVTYYAHTDHLGRPIKLTNSAKSAVWDAVWLPFGGAHSITGTLTHEHRLPGQWYQLEAGLHYNWHRQYDPSIGRYTQPDPLGFVDGPSQYAYARSGPQMYVDPDGRFVINPVTIQIAQAILRQAARAALGKLLDQVAAAPETGGAGGGAEMPQIREPSTPNTGCNCRCRAGNPQQPSSYRFAERSAATCRAAAKAACSDAGNFCTPGTANIHHSQAKCSDGKRYSGSGTQLN